MNFTRPKYRNTKTEGYDSKKEYRRAQELRTLSNAGLIAQLQEKVKFVLIPKQDGERECSYIADFVYWENFAKVVEDVKSPITKTPAYRIKRKLMLFIHGIKIREV